MEDVETWEKKNKRKERRGEQSEWEVGWKRSKTFPRGKTKNEMKSAMKKEKMMKSWTKLQNYDDRMLMKIRTEPIFPVGIVEADVRTVDRRHFFFILTSSQKAMNLFIYFFFYSSCCGYRSNHLKELSFQMRLNCIFILFSFRKAFSSSNRSVFNILSRKLLS